MLLKQYLADSKYGLIIPDYAELLSQRNQKRGGNVMRACSGKIILLVMILLSASPMGTAQTAATSAGFSFVAPMGGEIWETGETRGIFWICKTEPGPMVRVLLVQNGSAIRTLASSTAAKNLPNGQGIYQWTIPHDVIPGNNYQIRLESVANSAIAGVSNLFTIQFMKSYIKFDYPMAGISWNAGGLYPLRWSYHGYKWTSMSIFLKRRSGSQIWVVASDISIGQNDQGSYQWKVPSDVPSGGDYYLTFNMKSIRGWDEYGDSGNFSILNSTADFLLLTAPVNNTQWRAGETHAVTWKYPAYLNFKVNVLYELEGDTSTTKYHPIAWEIPVGSNGQGSFTWAIPENLAPGNYLLNIVGNGNNLKDSQKFIVAIPEYIRLLRPKAGETYENGRQLSVVWEFSGAPGPNVGVILKNAGNGATRVIGTNVPLASKIFNWTIPANEPSGQYQISVQSPNKSSYQATSDTFRIVQPASGSLTAPAASDYLHPGVSYAITWNYHVNTTTATAAIDLLKGGKMMRSIAAGVGLPQTQQQSNYGWLVPQNLETASDYQIRINIKDGMALVTAASQAFSIGPELKKIEVPPAIFKPPTMPTR
jgi:hypothetical protein